MLVARVHTRLCAQLKYVIGYAKTAPYQGSLCGFPSSIFAFEFVVSPSANRAYIWEWVTMLINPSANREPPDYWDLTYSLLLVSPNALFTGFTTVL